MAEVLAVEASYFFTPIHDEVKRQECSFRHLQSTSKQLLDQVVARGTLLRDVLAWALEIAELPLVDIPAIAASSNEEIEAAAARCREHWQLGKGPVSNTIRVAERAGILVTQLPGRSRKVDAFSHGGDPPLIVLASVKDSTSRARFDVMHEIGHLVIHRGQETGDKETERQADYFAGALLLPKSSFADEFRSLPTKDWPGYFELKRRWKVSALSILTRAHQLGLVGTAHYRRNLKYYYWKKWNKGEPFEPTGETPELLRLALEILEEEQGGLREVISRLGWTPELAEEILPVKVPGDPLPENVVSLNDWTN